jgi:hypothetical protein
MFLIFTAAVIDISDSNLFGMNTNTVEILLVEANMTRRNRPSGS